MFPKFTMCSLTFSPYKHLIFSPYVLANVVLLSPMQLGPRRGIIYIKTEHFILRSPHNFILLGAMGQSNWNIIWLHTHPLISLPKVLPFSPIQVGQRGRPSIFPQNLLFGKGGGGLQPIMNYQTKPLWTCIILYKQMSNSKYRLDFLITIQIWCSNLFWQFVFNMFQCFRKNVALGYANPIYYFLNKTFFNHTNIIHFSWCSSQNMSLGFQIPYGPQHLKWEFKLGIQGVHYLIPTYFSLYMNERFFFLGPKISKCFQKISVSHMYSQISEVKFIFLSKN